MKFLKQTKFIEETGEINLTDFRNGNIDCSGDKKVLGSQNKYATKIPSKREEAYVIIDFVSFVDWEFSKFGWTLTCFGAHPHLQKSFIGLAKSGRCDFWKSKSGKKRHQEENIAEVNSSQRFSKEQRDGSKNQLLHFVRNKSNEFMKEFHMHEFKIKEKKTVQYVNNFNIHENKMIRLPKDLQWEFNFFLDFSVRAAIEILFVVGRMDGKDRKLMSWIISKKRVPQKFKILGTRNLALDKHKRPFALETLFPFKTSQEENNLEKRKKRNTKQSWTEVINLESWKIYNKRKKVNLQPTKSTRCVTYKNKTWFFLDVST